MWAWEEKRSVRLPFPEMFQIVLKRRELRCNLGCNFWIWYTYLFCSERHENNDQSCFCKTERRNLKSPSPFRAGLWGAQGLTVAQLLCIKTMRPYMYKLRKLNWLLLNLVWEGNILLHYVWATHNEVWWNIPQSHKHTRSLRKKSSTQYKRKHYTSCDCDEAQAAPLL